MNRIATIVKGYPRLSETFIAQEILGLEKRGIRQLIVSLRQPTDGKVHDLHREIAAEILYLPEYLRDDPARVRAGRAWAEGAPPTTLGPGLRARPRIAARRGLAAHALPPHAGVGDALRGAAARPSLVVLGPRQGYLDDAGMGAARKAPRRKLGRHLLILHASPRHPGDTLRTGAPSASSR
jgi:hypothetical protein